MSPSSQRGKLFLGREYDLRQGTITENPILYNARHLTTHGIILGMTGSGKTRVTSNGAANFAPFFSPDGERIIFASNLADPRGRNFDLYLIDLDGSNLERVTTCPSFDSFPMFSPDGTKLAFASNRNGKVRGETNVFVADWVD